MSQNAYDDVIQTLADLYDLPPTLIDIDVITIMQQWNGPADYTPCTPYDFQVGYDHLIWGIGAFIQDPTDTPEDFVRVEFNIFNVFEQKNMFQKPLNCGAFFSTLGRPSTINPLPAFKKLPDRATLRVDLSPAQFDNVWEGGDKVIGVVLYGAKINTELMYQYVQAKGAQGQQGG